MPSLKFKLLVSPKTVLFLIMFTLLVLNKNSHAQEIPANTWVRVADCPGDEAGREVHVAPLVLKKSNAERFALT